MNNQNNTENKWKPRPRYMGVVSNWESNRKFGFIKCKEDGKSYFAHIGQLTDDYELIKGSIVEFEICTSKKEPDRQFAAKILVCEVPEEKSRNRGDIFCR